MGKLIIANLRGRLGSYLAVCAQIMIALIVGYIMLGELIPFIQVEITCKNLQLSQIVFCSSLEGEEYVSNAARKAGASVLCRNYQSTKTTDGEIHIQPVSVGFMTHFGYLDIDSIQSGDNMLAVVPECLSSTYEPGKTYRLSIGKDAQELSFSVATCLDNDILLIPPSGSAAENAVGVRTNTIYTVIPESCEEQFVLSEVYTLTVEGQKGEAVVAALLEQEGIYEAVCEELVRAYYRALDLEMMGIPIIIFICVMVLCFTGVISNTMLTLIHNERLNSIYFICGYTWNQCLRIQLLSDGIVFLSSGVGAFLVMWMLSAGQEKAAFSADSFGMSAVIVLTIFLLAEAMCLIQSKQNNVAEIAERIK